MQGEYICGDETFFFFFDELAGLEQCQTEQIHGHVKRAQDVIACTQARKRSRIDGASLRIKCLKASQASLVVESARESTKRTQTGRPDTKAQKKTYGWHHQQKGQGPGSNLNRIQRGTQAAENKSMGRWKLDIPYSLSAAHQSRGAVRGRGAPSRALVARRSACARRVLSSCRFVPCTCAHMLTRAAVQSGILKSLSRVFGSLSGQGKRTSSRMVGCPESLPR